MLPEGTADTTHTTGFPFADPASTAAITTPSPRDADHVNPRSAAVYVNSATLAPLATATLAPPSVSVRRDSVGEEEEDDEEGRTTWCRGSPFRLHACSVSLSLRETTRPKHKDTRKCSRNTTCVQANTPRSCCTCHAHTEYKSQRGRHARGGGEGEEGLGVVGHLQAGDAGAYKGKGHMRSPISHMNRTTGRPTRTRTNKQANSDSQNKARGCPAQPDGPHPQTIKTTMWITFGQDAAPGDSATLDGKRGEDATGR